MRAIWTLSLAALMACAGGESDKAVETGADSGGVTDDDADRDGYPASQDCDDADPGTRPGAAEVCDGADNDCDGLIDGEDDDVTGSATYTDGDGDGYGDDATAVYCDPDAAGVPYGGDCDDQNATINPGATEDDCEDPTDYNCDGSVGYADADGDGFPACEDCDDGDGASHPGASEVCDGADNDCDRAIDADDDGVLDAQSYYTDADADGYGDDGTAVLACEEQAGLTSEGGDCDDADPATHPGAEETDCADPHDYNCDGSVAYDDVDEDGFAACEDCDDTNAAASPAGEEVCDGADNDCDGATDDEDTDVTGTSTWYGDADGDGYGDPDDATQACEPAADEVASGTDCDDAEAEINPGAVEVCDELDNDCDDAIDDDDADLKGDTTWYADDDGDGYGDPDAATEACEAPSGAVADSSDCDDSRAGVNPAASETCDGLDNDCDGDIDGDDSSVSGASTWYSDDDGDGYGDAATTKTSCSQPRGYTDDDSDCDDGDDDIYPGAKEVCDDEDNDCDGLIDDDDSDVTDADTYYYDGDGDKYGDDDVSETVCDKPSGYVTKSGDCDDSDADINPGEADTCDAVDQDCNGVVDDGGTCPCEQDWNGDHSYLFCEAEYTWTSAQYTCSYYGYDLVTIEDASENTFVYNWTVSLDYYDYWWIGYNDRSTEGTWAWDSGSSSTYTSWTSGQPNGGSSEDCAMMAPYYGSGWYDYYCTYSYQNFICESP